jgi:hypothetical protein
MAAHRYWRLWLDRANGSVFCFASVEFRATSGGANWAAGVTYRASSTFTGFSVSAVFNGTGEWASQNTTNEWIEADAGVGNAFDIAEVMIKARASSGGIPSQGVKDFRVEYSDDGSRYYRDWAVNSQTSWTVGEVRVFTRPARTNQTRWRIWGANTLAGFNMGLNEIEFRSSYGGADTTSGGSAIFSSEFSAGVGAQAFDNNSATQFATANGDVNPAWIGYLYASPITIVETMVKARTDAVPEQAPQRFSLDTSANGTVWAVVAEWWTFVWTLGMVVVASVPQDTLITIPKIANGVLSGTDAAQRIVKIGDGLLSGAWPDRLQIAKIGDGLLSGAWPDRLQVAKIATQFLVSAVPRAVNGPVQII